MPDRSSYLLASDGFLQKHESLNSSPVDASSLHTHQQILPQIVTTGQWPEHSIEQGESSNNTESSRWIETAESKRQKTNPSVSDGDEVFFGLQQLDGLDGCRMAAGSSTDPIVSDQDICDNDAFFSSTELSISPEDQFLLPDDKYFTDKSSYWGKEALNEAAYSISNTERKALLSIAFPDGLVLNGIENLSSGKDKVAVSFIDPPRRPSLLNGKRKSTDDAISQSQSQSLKENNSDSKRRDHNAIEKKYRNNINDRFMELRSCVPSLRPVSPSTMGPSSVSNEEEREIDLDGLEAAHKFNKATIIAKAIEYIKHLEKNQRTLATTEGNLKVRIAAFEKLAAVDTLLYPRLREGSPVLCYNTGNRVISSSE